MATTQEARQGYRLVENEVRELIRQSGIDPLTDTEQAKKLIDTALADYEKRMIKGALPLIDNLVNAQRWLIDSICGFGELQQYLDDPTVEEIWINSPHEVFVARAGESELTGLSLTHEQVRYLVERMLKSSGRRLDLSSPFVDASLPDLSIVL
ncbi:hypothetical protein [Rothia terrae]|uniref:hypothetical protein n=1 Tax=Rothia terrae TaxID=396015 RepID=UPI001D152B08|nr:hypothetical protein [Rothia terrae]